MLIDSSGLLCLLHRSESFHALSAALFKNAAFRLTHSYVIAEFVALAEARKLPRDIALEFVKDLHGAPNIERVWADETLHREAFDLLLQRRDKTYSLCDAVSFVLMRRYRILEALTTDQHFEQEGFLRLLK